MSGFEVTLLSCVGINTAVNIVQSSGIWATFYRWFRLYNSRLVTVTLSHNPNAFYKISKMLHQVSGNLKMRTMISFGDAKVSHVYLIPDRNSEIEIPTTFGKIFIKVISLDNYHICAYEITCYNSEFDAVDKFCAGVLESIEPKIPADEMEHMYKLCHGGKYGNLSADQIEDMNRISKDKLNHEGKYRNITDDVSITQKLLDEDTNTDHEYNFKLSLPDDKCIINTSVSADQCADKSVM
ncbi:MAG: hypothetical protein Faunusvirus2_36 [Faunusvirus sp.]|jgi:hypothetical protein|uniref:Uncharacterized protein n=1 Tax=Faunusvirus sp. TaxID=2487766 RepID=A0A3G5A0J8_9VIRU|nr:MAG: hypothetical protein Faunusvirus2_36 [Faunusvirus sp.]